MSEAGISYYKKGAIVSYITIAVNIIASLLYTPWMLSKIGDSNYGLYTLATTLINMFLLDFGFSSAVSRFVAKYNAEGNQEKIDNFLGMLYKLYAIIVGVVLLVLTVLFNEIAFIFFIINFVRIKSNGKLIERIKARQKNQ